jgi:hypothetical protein
LCNIHCALSIDYPTRHGHRRVRQLLQAKDAKNDGKALARRLHRVPDLDGHVRADHRCLLCSELDHSLRKVSGDDPPRRDAVFRTPDLE